MYENGQLLTEDTHFSDHIDRDVPIQIYLNNQHNDIGFIQEITVLYVKINDTFYRRDEFRFISRPGY